MNLPPSFAPGGNADANRTPQRPRGGLTVGVPASAASAPQRISVGVAAPETRKPASRLTGNKPPTARPVRNSQVAPASLPASYAPYSQVDAPAQPAAQPAMPPAIKPSPAAVSQPAGTPSRQHQPLGNPAPASESSLTGRPHRAKRVLLIVLAAILVLVLSVIFWALYLMHRVDSNIGRVDALSSMADTPGETWLLAGSDAREGTNEANDGVEGQRSDTIMLVHKAENGQSTVVSLPRDTYVQIPSQGPNKLNTAFSRGGAPLLVQTVESLTGIKIDHFVQIGFNGVSQIVDAVGGVNVCWDQSFSDSMTQLSWEAGCHDLDGTNALLFARMRYADPLGDIGRTQRQRLLLAATLKKALSTDTLLSPSRQIALADAGAAAFSIDQESSSRDIARLMLTLRDASANQMEGVPPISSLGYNPGGIGSTVLLDPDRIDDFFARLSQGSLKPEDLQPKF